MEKENYYKVAIALLVIALFFLNYQYQQEKSANTELQSSIEDYQSALSDANSNIDDANSEIQDAQDSAWSDYDTMGSTLENLTTVDNVDDPGN